MNKKYYFCVLGLICFSAVGGQLQPSKQQKVENIRNLENANVALAKKIILLQRMIKQYSTQPSKTSSSLPQLTRTTVQKMLKNGLQTCQLPPAPCAPPAKRPPLSLKKQEQHLSETNQIRLAKKRQLRKKLIQLSQPKHQDRYQRNTSSRYCISSMQQDTLIEESQTSRHQQTQFKDTSKKGLFARIVDAVGRIISF